MKNSFKNKRVMILVPHQDDELNICGGLFTSNYFNVENVKIVFSTNGDYFRNYKTRRKEAYKVAKKIGIPKDNLIFLGYPDQFYEEKEHIYLTHEPNVFMPKKTDTEALSDNYHFKKYNEIVKFNHESFVRDIIDVIVDNKPEIIFAIDFDSHPDHRALSLAFDEAIGKILHVNDDYKPLIYKAFAYPTYYKGYRDFNDKKSHKTRFLTEPFSLSDLQNPYYNYDERISLDIKNNRLLLFNRTYKLFKKYRSQLIIKKIYAILNNDLIFFSRRSDNLLNIANIDVSSGDKKYLNDFMLFDVDTINHGNKEKVKFSNCALVFDKDDKKKEITIHLNKKYYLKELVLYQNLYDGSRVKEISVCINGKKKNYELTNNKQSIQLNAETNLIQISVAKCIGKNAGFTEIELFDQIKSNSKIFEEIMESKTSKILKAINDATLGIDIFIARVFNKIDRIRGKF